MCRGCGKVMGIAKSKPVQHLPGYSGIVLVEYTGSTESGTTPPTVFSGIRYPYGNERRRFYVDARDLTRLLAWRENGHEVFRMVSDDLSI